MNFSDPFGLCPEYAGGDGKTAGAGDCPREVLESWADKNVTLEPGVSWDGVDPTLRDAVIKGSIDLNMRLHVYSTNGGTHGPNSNHYAGNAVDISRINGVKFSLMDDARAFQLAPNVAAAIGAHIPQRRLREFIGPDISVRFHRPPGTLRRRQACGRAIGPIFISQFCHDCEDKNDFLRSRHR